MVATARRQPIGIFLNTESDLAGLFQTNGEKSGFEFFEIPRIISRPETAELRPHVFSTVGNANLLYDFQIDSVEVLSIAEVHGEAVLIAHKVRRVRLNDTGGDLLVVFQSGCAEIDNQPKDFAGFAKDAA